jgi:hypothetical protein
MGYGCKIGQQVPGIRSHGSDGGKLSLESSIPAAFK